jgi:cell division septation protein DedD
MSDDDKELPWLEPAVDDPAEGSFLEHYRMAIIAAGIFVIVAFALIIWQVYSGGGAQPGGEVPVVKAEEGPVKVKPEEPGGMEIPDRDKLIYGRVAGVKDGAETQHLRPGPETPLDAPEAVAGTAETPAAQPATAPETLPRKKVAEIPAAPQSKLPADTPAEAKKPVPVAVTPAPAAAQKGAAEKLVLPARAPVDKAVSGTKAPLKLPAAPTVPAAPASGDYLIQLGAFSDKSKAFAAWEQVQAKFPGVLTKLQPDVITVDRGSKGVLYRLQAGALASRASADDLCSTLKAKAQPCMVVHR